MNVNFPASLSIHMGPRTIGACAGLTLGVVTAAVVSRKISSILHTQFGFNINPAQTNTIKAVIGLPLAGAMAVAGYKVMNTSYLRFLDSYISLNWNISIDVLNTVVLKQLKDFILK